jgi:hypothetical protein
MKSRTFSGLCGVRSQEKEIVALKDVLGVKSQLDFFFFPRTDAHELEVQVTKQIKRKRGNKLSL